MKRLFSLTLLAIFLLAGTSYAYVTHHDGDIYGDNYTVESSTGNWDFSGTVTGKRNVTLITASTDTPSMLTVAKSGYVFILKPATTSAPVGGVGYTLTLPVATGNTLSNTFTGERFTFSTATNSTLSIRTGDSTIFYGTGVNLSSTRITSPAATGSTVTLIGSGAFWYVEEMTGAWVSGSA